MSDAPESKPPMKPRLSFLGLEAIAKDPANYESQGIARCVQRNVLGITESGAQWVRVWSIHGLLNTYDESKTEVQSASHVDLNNLLEAHDLYLVSIHVEHATVKCAEIIDGELYARKTIPSAIPVTNIEVGDSR